MSYLTQMAGLAVQNFVSAAVGIAVLAAVIRGIARRSSGTIGNFWVDTYRTLVYVLLPLSIVVAVLLIWQGVPQTFHGARDRNDGAGRDADDRPRPGRLADRDQAARHERRRLVRLELRRSAREPDRPLELHRDAGDPADPGGLQVFMFGRMVLARRHAWAVFAAMFVVFAIGVGVNLAGRAARLGGPPQLGREHHAGSGQSGGNMSDKEVRFGQAPTRRSGRPRRATPRTARSTAASTR